MAFEPGKPKTGGRPKGVPNKKTMLLSPLIEQLAKANFDPVKIILKNLPTLSPEMQVHVSLKLMDFIHPKKRSIEVTERPSKETLAQWVREYLEDEPTNNARIIPALPEPLPDNSPS